MPILKGQFLFCQEHALHFPNDLLHRAPILSHDSPGSALPLGEGTQQPLEMIHWTINSLPMLCQFFPRKIPVRILGCLPLIPLLPTSSLCLMRLPAHLAGLLLLKHLE